MTDKPKRKHNPAWADNTAYRRATERRKRLDEIAKAAGFDTWRKLETAALKNEVQIKQKT
jgi:hypothetical protein